MSPLWVADSPGRCNMLAISAPCASVNLARSREANRLENGHLRRRAYRVRDWVVHALHCLLDCEPKNSRSLGARWHRPGCTLRALCHIGSHDPASPLFPFVAESRIGRSARYVEWSRWLDRGRRADSCGRSRSQRLYSVGPRGIETSAAMSAENCRFGSGSAPRDCVIGQDAGRRAVGGHLLPVGPASENSMKRTFWKPNGISSLAVGAVAKGSLISNLPPDAPSLVDWVLKSKFTHLPAIGRGRR